MKNKKILFIIAVSLVLSMPYFIGGLHGGYDGLFHISRLQGIVDAWNEGQIIPRIYPLYNNNFGYGEPLFYCDIYLWPFAFLYKLGLTIMVSFKVMQVFYIVLSVVTIFYVLNKVFDKEYIPYIGTILYSFANYHLHNLHMRMDLGETYAIVFIPLALYAMYKILVKKENSWILLGVSFSLLLFAHNLTFLLYCVLFLVFIIIFVVLNIKDKQVIKSAAITTLKGTLLAILLSSWFLIPMLEQLLDQSFNFQTFGTYYDLSTSTSNILRLLNYNKGFMISNPSLQDTGIGYCLIILPIAYIFVKKDKVINILFIINLILWLCVLGIIPIHLIKAFNTLQFIFRLYILIFPLSVIISLYSLENINNQLIIKVTIVLAIITSLISMYFITVNNYINGDTYSDDTKYEELWSDSLFSNEGYNYNQMMAKDYMPAMYDYDYINDGRNIKKIDIEDAWKYEEIILNNEFIEESSQIYFEYTFEEEMYIALPKTYYKGYQAYLIDENGWTKLETFGTDVYHLVGIKVPAGQDLILCKYSGTKMQKITPLISLLTLFLLILYKLGINDMIKKYLKGTK